MSKKEEKQVVSKEEKQVVSKEEMSAFLRSKTNQYDAFQAPKPTLKIKRLRDNGFPLPKYQTPGSAGMDLQADVLHTTSGALEEVPLMPGMRMLIKTGLSIELPSGFEAQIRTRSGLALKQGLVVLNSPGTVDADYRGEVGVIILNASEKTQSIKHGDRIAQMVIAKVEQLPVVEVAETSKTERGEGGFGSTGVK